MRIGGLQKTSLIDFPGRVSAVVFLQGCNMRCPFCHNPELVLPHAFDKPMDEADLFSFLRRRVGQLDGIVISGGEPTVHRDLPDFVTRIRALGYAVKLDTNGSNPAMLGAMLGGGLLDYVAMDVKGPPGEYKRFCGANIPGEAVTQSIRAIIDSGVAHEFRTTAVPGLHTLEVLLETAACVRGADRYVVQAFRPSVCLDETMNALPPFDLAQVRASRERFAALVKEFDIRGGPSKETPAKAGVGLTPGMG
jgi:pyruvate formate lyase activating enzyme